MITREAIDKIGYRVGIEQVFRKFYPNNTIKDKGNHLEACCPYHNDHRPSLWIEPDKNKIHCFVCGKDLYLIPFVMEETKLDFPKAIRYIYENFLPNEDINSIYEKETEASVQRHSRYTLQLEVMAKAHDFYREQYNSNTEEAIKCRKYAEIDDEWSGRWESGFCQTTGLAYSPSSGFALYNWAKKNKMDIQTLVDVGLLKEKVSKDTGLITYYDFFRGRLLIPIRNVIGQVVAYTGRRMDGIDEFKYINNSCGKENLIYKKSSTPYGLDVAMKSTFKAHKCYLMEGAPDAMRLHSLGITNAMASTGGCWNKQQLSILKRGNPTLCFIPDADIKTTMVEDVEVKIGESFVFKSAQLAIKMGFSVYVKEIPSDRHKEDVDSYIKTVDIWNSLEEEDFVMWYARKLYNKRGSREEKLNIATNVCQLLTYTDSETLRLSYLNELKDLYPPNNIWDSAISEALKETQERKREEKFGSNLIEFKRYSFWQNGKHYCSFEKNGEEDPWTNFILIPKYLINFEGRSVRVISLENEDGDSALIELETQQCSRMDMFIDAISAVGNYDFMKEKNQFKKLRSMILQDCKQINGINKMGLYINDETELFAFANGIMVGKKWMKIDDYGIINFNSTPLFIPAFSKLNKNAITKYSNMRRFEHICKKNISADEYFSEVQKVFGDNGIISICFYMSSLFRDIIYKANTNYPILYIFGVTGSGKTQLSISMASMLQSNVELSNLESTSLFSIGQKMTQSVNGITSFEEYWNTIGREKNDLIKGAYDSTGRTIKDDLTGERVQFSATTGIIITGQDIPDVDPALLSRMIFLEQYKTARGDEERENMRAFKKLRGEGVTSVTLELLPYRDGFRKNWEDAWEDAINDLRYSIEATDIEERLFENWSVPYATAIAFNKCGKTFPFTREKVKAICVAGIKKQHKLMAKTNEYALFWENLFAAFKDCRAMEDQDFKLKDSISKPIKFRKNGEHFMLSNKEFEHSIIYLNVDACINSIQKKEKQLQWSKGKIVSILQNSPEYLGSTFYVEYFYEFDDQGRKRKVWQMDKRTQKEELKTVRNAERPLVFDYTALKKRFGIDFTRHYESITDTD